MARVSDLSIKLQTGSSNTVYASWKFHDPTPSSGGSGGGGGTSGSVSTGSLVTIKSGATWYNGVAIDSWVFSYKWYVYELIGDRAVLNANESGSNHIMSPINVNNLQAA